MKRNQIILIGIFILITALIFLKVNSNKKEPIKELKEAKTLQYLPISIVKNVSRNLDLISYGQVSPNTELDISFEVQGKLERGNITLKPGVKFRANQLLYKVNQEEAFYSLTSRKSQLANLVIGIMPDIELDFPSEKNKWLNFMDNLAPEKRLPELPIIKNSKERMFVTSRGILTEYYSIKAQEARMEKYFYLAPFSGTVLEIFSEPGAVANPGARIARIAKTGDLEVKVPISLMTIKKFQQKGSASFTDGDGKVIGTGKIIRISDVINQKTQSVDVYYSIKPVNKELIYNGQFVNVSINQMAAQESFGVPRIAVTSNQVNVIENQKIVVRDIVVVGSKPDTLFVSGLKNGDELVLEQLEKTSEVKIYKGIKH